MATGIIIPELIELAYYTAYKIITSADAVDVSDEGLEAQGPWTPPQWSKPALTIVTVPPSAPTATGGASGASSDSSSMSTNYVFDAILRSSHRRTVRKTQHPVLSGANISDHAYIEPSKLTLEIGMSDAMAAYPNSPWVGATTKSVSAWQILKGLQMNRILLTITTRLDTYYNMLIVDCFSMDENKTLHGLRATIIMEEIIAAGVASTSAASSRPQTTGENPSGVVQSSAVDSSQANQHVVPSSAYPTVQISSVAGAGDVSSNSLSQLA